MRIAKGLIIIGLCLIVASGVAFAGDKKLKAGFIYVGSVGDFGWTHAHNVGRKYAESKLPWLETIFIEKVPMSSTKKYRIFMCRAMHSGKNSS